MSGRYRIEAELGRGGMGSVERAVDLASGETVALKTLDHDSPRLVALFEREYQTLSALHHPRVIKVFDYGITEDGRRYYTMELLQGAELGSLAPVPWQKACEYLRDVATSLALLHARGLLHRDVSPRNVRLANDGRAKLLDFGALCPFGSAGELVGTPPFMAPEALRQQSLDARTDLYSLGALGYWLVTGRTPFDIRSVREAEPAFRMLPLPPSAFAQGLPNALDQLLLALLSVDPMQRPSSAAEVVERLGAIGQLDEESLSELAQSHLLSAPLTGRERELEKLQALLQRMLRGQGGAVVVEGPAGMGRSRLAHELSVHALLAGVAVVRVDTLAHTEPNGLVKAIAEGLLRAAPSHARRSLMTHIADLGEAFPDLKPQLGSHRQHANKALPKDSAERRARVQNALTSFVLDVAKALPLLILVDDAHAADLGSAGALLAMANAAQNTRLLLVASQLSGAPAPVALQQLVKLGSRISLRGLKPLETEQLLSSLLGDVPHRTRLAQWLGSVAQGNPGQTLELLRDLIECRVIRYEGGTWALPAELPERELPSSVEEAIAKRLAQLSPDARRLAQLLALHRGSLPRTTCFALARSAAKEQTVAALNQLTTREIVADSVRGYRLVHEGMRALLIAQLSEPELQALYVQLSGALIDAQPDLFKQVARGRATHLNAADLGTALQVGWFLLCAGDSKLGRDLLHHASIELGIRGEGLVEAVPILESAISLYKKQGRSPYECLALMVPLTLAGTYTDFRLGYRYGEEALEILLELSGLRLATRLARHVGGTLALLLALPCAAVLFYLTSRRRGTRSFAEAILGVIGLGSATLGACVIVDDRQRAQRIVDSLRALSFFPARHTVRVIVTFQLLLLDAVMGRLKSDNERSSQLLNKLRQPGGLRGVPEEARLQLEVGLCHVMGHWQAQFSDGAFQETLQLVDSVRTSVSRQCSAGISAAHHANRGERVRFLEYQEHVDLLAAQAGSTWREDLIIPRRLWPVQAMSEDVLALKRSLRQLEVVAPELPSLSIVRDIVHACYLAERGFAADALRRFAGAFQRRIADRTAMSLYPAAAYARILRQAGRAKEALRVCEEALASQPGNALLGTTMDCGVRIERGLARAALGDLTGAATLLDQLLQSHEAHDNPLLHGLSHKARAQVALWSRDSESFERHLQAMESWLRRTDNPALIAQCQRLAQDGRSSQLIGRQNRTGEILVVSGNGLSNVDLALSSCKPGERLQVALELLVEASGAARGHLYLLEADELRLVDADSEPPSELTALVQGAVGWVQADEQAGGHTTEHTAFTTCLEPGYRDLGVLGGVSYVAHVLRLPASRSSGVIGVVALVASSQAMTPLPPALAEELAQAISQSADVPTLYEGRDEKRALSRA